MSPPPSALDATQPALDESADGDAELVPADPAAEDPAAGQADDPSHAPTYRRELTDSVIGFARVAAEQEAGSADPVGDYLGAIAEDDIAVSAAFAAADRSYRGWYWSVTLALVDPARPTISEVVLLPGQEALLAPPWVPWDRRIRAGDVGAGDLLPTPADDIRLVPGYVDSDDPAVREVAYEFGFGRARVLSREGRDEAAQRWHDGPFGPDDPTAATAQAQCVTCGFYVPLEGLLGMALGACANEYSPADGRVVDAEFGCGAHSDTVIDAPLISASTATVVDEFTLEVHHRSPPAADAAPDQPPGTDLDPAPEIEPDLPEDVVGDSVLEAADPLLEAADEAADPVLEAAVEAADPGFEAGDPVLEAADEAADPVLEAADALPAAEPDGDPAGPAS